MLHTLQLPDAYEKEKIGPRDPKRNPTTANVKRGNKEADKTSTSTASNIEKNQTIDKKHPLPPFFTDNAELIPKTIVKTTAQIFMSHNRRS